MVAMTLPAKPWTHGMMTADGTRMFDSTVGSEGAWRATPIPAGGLPAGSIIQWSSNTAPPNWFICDGSAVSRALWPSLFAVIGTTYGAGDGSTTFNLPDLRGRVAVGRDGSQTEFDVLGETGGSKTHRHDFKIALFDSGNYGVSGPNAAMGGANQGGAYRYSTGAYQGGLNDTNITLNGEIAGTASSRSLGRYASTGDTDTGSSLQPYLVTNYIIKATTGWSAGDSELALRMAAAETASATTNKSGLVPIVPTGALTIGSGSASYNSLGFVTFSGCTYVTIPAVFSSSYAFYKVIIESTSTDDVGHYLRLNNVATGYYWTWTRSVSPSTAQTISNTDGSGSGIYFGSSYTGGLAAEVDIFSPNKAANTRFIFNSAGNGGSTYYAYSGGGYKFDTTQYVNVTVLPGTGSFSGTIRIYGYNQE